MPTYQSVCEDCGKQREYIRPISRRNKTPSCCGKPMKRAILTAPAGFVLGRFEPFRSSVDGTVIRGQRELQEHNKRNNVVNLADGYSEDRILSGDYVKPEQESKKEKLRDVAEAVKMVNAGYKPVIRSADDELN